MSSPVEKYELILAADPRSRIFVELARALAERGDHARAVEVARAGLAHHPDSAQARIVLGRSLLATGQPGAALEQLEQAASAAPADPRLRELLDEARAAVPAPELAPASPTGDGERVSLEDLDLELQGLAAEAATPTAMWPAPGAPAEVRGPPPPPAPAASAPRPAAVPEREPEPEITGKFPFAPPPLRRSAARSAATDDPGSPLAHLPAEAAPRAAPAPAREDPGLPDPEEAARIAARYERELREKMLPAEPASPARRHGPAIALAAVATLVVASGVVYWLVRQHHRADDARAAVAAARAGLARDTLGSLREAARVLDEARVLDPSLGEAFSLSAQVNALLWADFADAGALERARTLAAAPGAGEGALVARYLAAPGAAERDAAAEALLQASAGSGPLLRTLAAGILRGRGDLDGARHHLEAAARGTPPMLRALADLGDLARAADPEQALRLYRTALQAHATHPRAALGAAEVALQVGRGLAEAAAQVEAVRRDPQSAPPGADRLRAELLLARLYFAQGRSEEAVGVLDAAATRFAGRAEIHATAAEVELARGEVDRALAAAERAVRISPEDAASQELLARARLARGRWRELLRDTEGTSSRVLRLLRAQARVELGDLDRARAELEATRRDGRMPAEAAAWMAVCDATTGRGPQAAVVLQALGAARERLPAALLAQGRLHAAGGQQVEAEQVLRATLALPEPPLLARLDLAQVLRRGSRVPEAVEVLAEAVRQRPHHPGARLALAQVRLEAGDAKGAAADAARAAEERPRDPDVLRLLSSARREAGDARGAREAAERALQAAPRDPESWIAAGRAAAALGDGATARRELTRAAKLAGKGARAAEAKRLLASLPK